MLANYERLLRAAGVGVEFGVEADADVIERYAPDEVIVASGARPFEPRHSFSGVEVVQAWDVLDGMRPDGHIVIADWGGDAAGLDCAATLAAQGRQVTLAVSAPIVPGETPAPNTTRQLRHRPPPAGAGVRLEAWLGLEARGRWECQVQKTFCDRTEISIRCDVLVLSLGRVPNQGLEAELRARRIVVTSAGDCRSPRGLEEAILEGTLAGANVSQVRSPQAVG